MDTATLSLIFGLAVPFAGTVLGSALVMFMSRNLGDRLQKALLGFAADAMMYVVVEELIPDTQNGKHTNIGTVGLAIGFALMMTLDVALG